MDLYQYYSHPEQLNRYADADDIVPSRIYANAKSGVELTPKQINTIAKNAKYAYEYAYYVLDRAWPKSEDAISKDATYAYYYARNVLKSPWPKGEDAIAKDAYYAFHYAYYVLKLPEEQARRWGSK